MATGTITSNSSISTIGGYCVFAQSRFGSNGDPSGDAENLIGGASGAVEEGRSVWDADLSNGLDSGFVTVNFTAEAGGGTSGVKWTVSGASPTTLTFTHRTYGAIQQVLLRAGVQIPAQFHWAAVTVKFYRNGRVTEQYVLSSGPEVDTSASSPPIAAEQILTVVPGFNNNTKVAVTGSIRLVCAPGITPLANDIFGEVFLYADSCTAV